MIVFRVNKFFNSCETVINIFCNQVQWEQLHYGMCVGVFLLIFITLYITMKKLIDCTMFQIYSLINSLHSNDNIDEWISVCASFSGSNGPGSVSQPVIYMHFTWNSSIHRKFEVDLTIAISKKSFLCSFLIIGYMFFLVNVAKIQFSYLIYCAIKIPLT